MVQAWGRGSAARGASFGLVTSTAPVSSLDWAAYRVAQAGWVLAAGTPSATCGCCRHWPGARAATSGSRTVLGMESGLLEEDLAMSDRTPAGDADDQRGSEPDLSATDEFAKMRAVMRASEKHREGGVDPELEVTDADPGPDT